VKDDIDSTDLDGWVASLCASVLVGAICISRPSIHADAVVDHYKRFYKEIKDSWE
jgi:hypothetical protein